MQKIVMTRVMMEEQRSDNNYVSAEIGGCNMFDKEMHVHRSNIIVFQSGANLTPVSFVFINIIFIWK